MSSAEMKLFPIPLSPAPGKIGIHFKWNTSVASKRVLVPSQMNKCNKPQIPQAQIQKTPQVSRRDIMQYTAATPLLGLAPLFTEPAEARVGRLSNKRKTMEKLEKLRKRSETPNPKAKAKATEENILPIFPLPPLSGQAQPLVEATINNIQV